MTVHSCWNPSIGVGARVSFADNIADSAFGSKPGSLSLDTKHNAALAAAALSPQDKDKQGISTGFGKQASARGWLSFDAPTRSAQGAKPLWQN